MAEDEEAQKTAEQSVDSQADGDGGIISWQASEFIQHDKSAGWYGALALAAGALAGLIYLVTRDIVSVLVIVVAAVLLGIYASHKPKQVDYSIDGTGLSIDDKHYEFDEFRCFSLAPEDAFSSIVFMPLKRFALPTTVYYDPEDEARIVEALKDRLPFEDHKLDAVDRMLRKIRF